VKDGRIHVRVPTECVSTEIKTRKRARKTEIKPPVTSPKPILTPVQGIYGATAAVVIEANRAGKKVRPMEAEEIVALLQEAGHEVKPLGPRLYLFQGKTSNISDLLEAANKHAAKQGEGTIILEMRT
jgi:hypothetical protein